MTTTTEQRDALLRYIWRMVVDDWYERDAVAARLDALIAAVEARATLTPERLAKAMHEASVSIGCLAAAQSDVHRMDHEQDAAALLAALATDEAVP